MIVTSCPGHGNDAAQPQRGADGGQPFSSVCTRSSGAAGPRRSRWSFGEPAAQQMSTKKCRWLILGFLLVIVIGWATGQYDYGRLVAGKRPVFARLQVHLRSEE